MTWRTLLLVEVAAPVVRYPDSGKVGIWTAGDGYQSLLSNEPELDSWEGEP